MGFASTTDKYQAKRQRRQGGPTFGRKRAEVRASQSLPAKIKGSDVLPASTFAKYAKGETQAKSMSFGQATYNDLLKGLDKKYLSFGDFHFGIDRVAPPRPKPPVLPELEALKGKDVNVSCEHMPGAPVVKCKWEDESRSWLGEPGWDVSVVVQVRYTDRPEDGPLSTGKFLTAREVEQRMRAQGHSALRVIGEFVREQVVFLLTHELDECLKIDNYRVRNPHPPHALYFSFRAHQAQYGDATALDTIARMGDK